MDVASTIETATEYLAQGGAVMWPLCGGAILLWFGLAQRFVLLRRGSMHSVSNLVRRSLAGEQDQVGGLIGDAVSSAKTVYEQNPPYLRSHLDEAFLPIEERAKSYNALVLVITASAPLAGLLGTVGGMIETFDSLGEMSLFTQSGGIAGGISQALFTTQMGLSIGIPGLLIGRLLLRKQEQLLDELEQIKDIVCQLPTKGVTP